VRWEESRQAGEREVKAHTLMEYSMEYSYTSCLALNMSLSQERVCLQLASRSQRFSHC
jgi:hypothetical protein